MTMNEGDGTQSVSTYPPGRGPASSLPSTVTTTSPTGHTATTTYTGRPGNRQSTTTVTQGGVTTTTTCSSTGCTSTTSTAPSAHEEAHTDDIVQNFMNNDGVNGRDGDAGLAALEEWYEARGEPFDDVDTLDRHAVNYAHCMSFGLSGCDPTDGDATQAVMFREGVSLGLTGDGTPGDFDGDAQTTNYQNSIWFDRCPVSICGDGYIPPGGHTTDDDDDDRRGNNGGNNIGGNRGSGCRSGLIVLSAYINTATNDDGCRPPRCDFGRDADGWCLPPASADPPVVYIIGPGNVDENDGRASFRIELSHPTPQPVSVTVFTRGGTALSAQGDFTAVNRRVTIRASSTVAWVDVRVIDDSHDEPDETFTLHMSAPSSNAELSARTSAEATIVDNDDPAAPGAPQNLLLVCSVSNSGATLTASWDPPSGNPPASRYETSFSSSDPGDVMSPTDEFYNNRILTNGSPFIHSEDRDQDGLPDTGAEVQVSGPGEYWVRVVPTWQGGGTPATASTQCLPVVSLDDTALTVSEGSSVPIGATLDVAPAGTARVFFSTSGGVGATSSCFAGADFAVDSGDFIGDTGSFTFTAADTTASITFTACDDTDTTDETVTLVLTTTGISGLQLGTPTTVVVTITDDDTGGGRILT